MHAPKYYMIRIQHLPQMKPPQRKTLISIGIKK